MTIYQVINNNQVICLDSQNKECIAVGRGIGFKAKVGQHVPDEKIEKIFRLSNSVMNNKFQQLVAKIPMEHIQVTDEIISHVKKSLDKKIGDNIYVSLTDHINFAIERYQQGMQFHNAMLWEAKRLYRQEFQLGKYALRHIESRIGIQLPEDEAGFIALHIVNAELDNEMDQTVEMTHIIQGILNIIKYHFKKDFQEDSLNYERFLTHLRFFAQRLISGVLLAAEDLVFCEMMKKQCPEEYRCVEKISAFVQKRYEHEMTEEEKMYLVVHIRRLMKEEE